MGSRSGVFSPGLADMRRMRQVPVCIPGTVFSVHLSRHLDFHEVAVLRTPLRHGHLLRRATENLPHKQRFLHGIGPGSSSFI